MKKNDRLSKSTVAVVATASVVLLGFLGYRVMQSMKKVAKKPDLQKDRDTIETPLASVEPSETKNVNDRTYLKNVSGVRELMRKVSWTLLTKNPDSAFFASREDFLGEFIRTSFRYIVNPMWYERLPKNVDELENLLKDFKLYDKYKKKLLLHNSGNDYRVVYEFYTVPRKGRNRRTVRTEKLDDCLS